MLFFSSIFMIFKFFSKKILVLIFLEMTFLSIILLSMESSFCSSSHSSFLCGFFLLTFMVLDSVYGLCLLIFVSRNSTVFSNFMS